MHLSDHIHTSKEQLARFLETAPKDTPITMVNIVRYKSRVAEENASGEDIYNRYGIRVLPMLKKVGGRIIWRGTVHATLIGDDSNPPHVVLLVKYPSSDHFMRMVTDEDYQKIANDRTISIEYGGLLATTTDYESKE